MGYRLDLLEIYTFFTDVTTRLLSTYSSMRGAALALVDENHSFLPPYCQLVPYTPLLNMSRKPINVRLSGTPHSLTHPSSLETTLRFFRLLNDANVLQRISIYM